MIIQLIILNIFFVDLQYKLSGKLDTQMSQKLFYTEKLFTQRNFYTQQLLHAEAFTQRGLYT
jgi:hypothetical protein